MQKQTRLFVACVIALVSVAFGFIIRSFLISEWEQIFNLSKTQSGWIQGAGVYPQALTIIFFSLIVDRIGYGRVIAFAWITHVISAIVTISATGFSGLYWGTFLFALANGAVEAVINPVAATLYPNSKTSHLNILHSGWPGGLVLGGVLALLVGNAGGPDAWKWKVALYLIPTAIYGLMMLGQSFPKQERVAAGVSYNDMLKEFGIAGCAIVSIFVAMAIDQILVVFGLHPNKYELAVIPIVLTALFATRVHSFGRPMFIFLLFVMMLSATTEISTDSWITSLMEPVLKSTGANASKFVLIYASAIMFVLRFCAGPITRWISPLGLLTICSAIAAIGLYWLANAHTAAIVFLAATFYGLGKTFFWPTTLGVVAEQFPKGGALTLNAIAAVGMISIGVLGNPLLGTMQDRFLDQRLAAENPELHEKIVGPAQTDWGMTFQPIDQAKVKELPKEEQQVVENTLQANSQATLGKVAILPIIMCFCYAGLLLYFKSLGGYRPTQLAAH